jgi:membrane-associated phospholipid phosphatase
VNALPGLRKAHRWLWSLVVVAIVLTGALSRVMAAQASPVTGLVLAVVASLLALVITQICRLMLAIGRATSSRSSFSRIAIKRRALSPEGR